MGFDPVHAAGRVVPNLAGGTPATIEVPAWRDGALEFSGAGAVTVRNQPALNPGVAITVLAWIRPDALEGFQEIVHKAPAANGYDFNIRVPGHLQGRVFSGSDGRRAEGGDLLPGRWALVAMTYHEGAVELWIDGLQVAASAGAPLPIGATAIPLTIGNTNERSAPFRGLIGEVRLFDRALNATEISGLYNESCAPRK